MIRNSEVSTTNGTAQFDLLEGVVTHHQTQRWAETHVSSGGGGGFVHPEHGGHVHSAPVNSKVVSREHTQFWLTDEIGVQHPIQLSNETMPTADGHKVRVIWGRNKNGKNAKVMLYARNYASQQDVIASDKELYDWACKQNLLRYPRFYMWLFSYIPALFVLYLTIVWVPSISIMVENGILPRLFNYKSNSAYLLNSFLVHFQHFDLFTPAAIGKAIVSEGISFGGIFAMLAIMAVLHVVSNIFAYMLIGHRLHKKMMVPIKKGLEEIANTPVSA